MIILIVSSALNHTSKPSFCSHPAHSGGDLPGEKRLCARFTPFYEQPTLDPKPEANLFGGFMVSVEGVKQPLHAGRGQGGGAVRDEKTPRCTAPPNMFKSAATSPQPPPPPQQYIKMNQAVPSLPLRRLRSHEHIQHNTRRYE